MHFSKCGPHSGFASQTTSLPPIDGGEERRELADPSSLLSLTNWGREVVCEAKPEWGIFQM